MVCAPGRAHQRLTPSNCDTLLFDDVMWVDNAKRDHFDFMHKMRDRGVDVVEMHSLLAETVAIPEAQEVDPRQPGRAQPGGPGPGRRDQELPRRPAQPRDLAETLIGGLSTEEFPETHGGEMLKLVKDAAGVTEYLLPPLPNTLYTRDTTCWIYGGVTLNPLLLAGAARGADPHHGDLQVSSRLRRQGQGLVGRSDRGPWPGDARGRRRHADRQGQSC